MGHQLRHLYLWPTCAMMLLLTFPQIMPWQLAEGVLMVAMLPGSANYGGIEKPFREGGCPRPQTAIA